MTAPNPFIGDDDVEDAPQPDQSGSALRKWGKEQAKLAEDLRKELELVKAQLATRAAADIFSKLGVPEKVRKFYSGDPTEDNIAAWVKENADVFGLETVEATQTEEQQQAHQEIAQTQQATQLGQDRAQAFSREALAEQRSNLLSQKNPTLADLDATLAKMGVPNLPMVAPQF